MAKFKALVRFQRNDGFYPVYIRVAHKDKSGFIKTDKVVDAKGVGKDKTYSCYTFRHTWATVAQNECGASISEVGFAMNHSDRSRVTRTYVKVDFTPARELNEKVVEKIFFTEELSRHHNHEEENKLFERFSFKQLIRGTLFFRGKAIATIEDIGFNNVDEIIEKLMELLPDTIPPRTIVQVRIENLDKGQKQDYTRMVKLEKRQVKENQRRKPFDSL